MQDNFKVQFIFSSAGVHSYAPRFHVLMNGQLEFAFIGAQVLCDCKAVCKTSD